MSQQQTLFSAQERVDLLDMQIVTSYAADELRRMVRQLISGEGGAHVLRGFNVTAEASGTSSRVLAKLNLGGGVLSGFVGALGIDGGIFDFGQVGGDHGALGSSDFNGQGQFVLDFTGQPPGTYDVKLRATIIPAAPDNRAFWDDVGHTEFVASVQTRLLLRWELAYAGNSDPDWVLLAHVNWNGTNVSDSDIIDARDLALEGKPRNEATAALRWSHADQPSSAAAVIGDFNRAEDRGGNAALSALYDGFRALARQVQDLKGGRESDLRFDWFSRPYQAPGGGFDAQQTKSLRTVDTVTFTVADGTTEQGDFNGATGLYDCFAYIAANTTNLPRKIVIVVKSRLHLGVSGPIFTWTAPVTIAEHDIQVRVAGGNAHTSFNPSVGPLFSGACFVNGSALSAGQTLLALSDGSLDIEDLIVFGIPTTSNVFDISNESVFRARRCSWSLSGAVDADTTGFAIRAGHQGLAIEDCYIFGPCWLGGRPIGGGNPRDVRGAVRRTVIQGWINTRFQNPDGITASDRHLFANGLTIEDCVIEDTTAGHTPRAEGAIDLMGARHVTLQRCLCRSTGDQDFVVMRNAELATDTPWPSTNIRILDNHFVMVASATHAPLAGIADIEGSGWMIKGLPIPSIGFVADEGQLPSGIIVSGNVFEVADGIASSPDAGAIVFYDCRDCRILDNDIIHWSEPPADSDGMQYLIVALATTSGVNNTAGQCIRIEGNFVGRWQALQAVTQAWGGGALCCVLASNLLFSQVSGNVLSAVTDHGDVLDASPDLFPGALQVNNAGELDIVGNQFVWWRSTSAPDTTSTAVGLIGFLTQVRVLNCSFHACGGDNLVVPDGAVNGLMIRGCDFHVGTDDTKFAAAIIVGDSVPTEQLHIHHCMWDYDGSADFHIAINVGPAGQFSVFGNYFNGGQIRHATLGGSTSPTSFGYGLFDDPPSYPNNSFNFLIGSDTYQ